MVYETKISNVLGAKEFYILLDETRKKKPLILIALDFDNFNYINDLFSYSTGDLVLSKIQTHFYSCLNEGDFFSRIYTDHFAFCLTGITLEGAVAKYEELTNFKACLVDVLPPHYNLVTSAGFLVIDDTTSEISALMDNANYARKLSKGNLVSTYNVYDETMSKEIEWKKKITPLMEEALENREFEMYLQPKLLVKTEEIVGAEALVRWNNPSLGLIYPDRFIDIMEQNGFIRQLDFFMLEEACRFINMCKKRSYPLIPISVNFSKSHLYTEDVVKKIYNVVNSNNVPTSLIEIEFTESLFTDNINHLIQIISDLKLIGFKVTMDDFGSAYSSLNTMKDLPLDIIKIDRAFLNATTNFEKGQIIIAKMVELIKSMRMVSVMEGVESVEQLEFLNKLSCDIAQGYLFSKPMPAPLFIDYLKVSKVSHSFTPDNSDASLVDNSYMYSIPQEFQMDNWELFILSKNIDMGLMKGYLDTEATVQYINDRALEYLGYSRREFKEIFNNSISAFSHPDDVELVMKTTELLVNTGKPLPFETRAIRKDGRVIHLKGRASCIIDNHGRPVGIYAFQEVFSLADDTIHEYEKKINELNNIVSKLQDENKLISERGKKYELVFDQTTNIIFEWDFGTDKIRFDRRFEVLFDNEYMFDNFSNNSLVKSYVHPDDLCTYEKWLSETYRHSGTHTVTFRLYTKTGGFLWISCKNTTILDDTGIPLKAVGIFSNIQQQKEEFDHLLTKSQLDPLTKLLNKEEIKNHVNSFIHNNPKHTGALLIIDIDDFKTINDTLGHQLGDHILVDFANSIVSALPEDSLVGRIGGDEFAVYLPFKSFESLKFAIEKMSLQLKLSYYGSKKKYDLSSSVGISCYPDNGLLFEELYPFADIALYNAKNKGKDTYVVYSKSIEHFISGPTSEVDYSYNFLNTYFRTDFTYTIFEMLYESKDIYTSINLILQQLGEKFEVDRVYIFEMNNEKKTASNTYEWCASSITSEREGLQDIPLSMLSAYLDNYSSEGVFFCEDINDAPKNVYELCHPQGIKSLLHCAIYNEGKIIGFIGFDHCYQYHKWSGEEVAILGYVSRILSVYLHRGNINIKLETSLDNYVEMIDNLSGFVYVIDPNNYDILYINKQMRALGLKSGQACYKMAYGTDTPCANCPARKLSDKISSADEDFYSEILDGWVKSTASTLKWTDNRDAVLIYCTDISKYKNS